MLRYLSRTHTDGIFFGKSDEKFNTLWGWVDADFAADLDTRRSHTGYKLMLNGGAESWRSTEQKRVSLSTTEAERYDASESGKEVMFLPAIMEHG